MTTDDQRKNPAGFSFIWLAIAVLLAATLWIRIDRPATRPQSEAEAAAARADWPDMRVDVNAATTAELTLLPRIGPTLAENIVMDREASGSFRSVDDLDRVHRIGPRTIEELRPFVIIIDEDEAPDRE